MPRRLLAVEDDPTVFGAQALAAERWLEVVEKGGPATSLRALVETLLHGGA